MVSECVNDGWIQTEVEDLERVEQSRILLLFTTP